MKRLGLEIAYFVVVAFNLTFTTDLENIQLVLVNGYPRTKMCLAAMNGTK